MEKRYIRKDGNIVWGNLHVALIRHDLSKRQTIIGMVSDITEKKNMELKIKQSEKKYKNLTDSINDIFFALDKELNFTYVNKACGRLFNIDPDIIIGTSYYDFSPNKDFRWIADKYKEVIWSGKTQNFEAEFSMQDAVFWFEIIAYPSLDGCSVFIKNITKRKHTEIELKRHRKELQRLSNQLMYTQEQERTRIARELHDELGQAVTALNIDLSRLYAKIENKSEIENIYTGMKDLINLLDNTLHRIQSELRPGILDDLGLLAALDWKVKDFIERTGIDCTFIHELDDTILDRELSTALYRIVQEGLTNIMRHAGAGHVKISIQLQDDNVVLVIGDNGCGIDPESMKKQGSFGLFGMRERIAPWNGELVITAEQGKGTILTVRIPHGECVE
jgi:PAS domain S-box-containing protein